MFSERVKYPHIISHRGASGYIPEHSFGAYQTAIDLQTDYIEPDLCLTKDNIFVAVHDITLDDVTDVSIKYPERYTTKIIGNKKMSGYFVSDFLYSEIETLLLKQRLDYRTDFYDYFFKIPTLKNIFDLVQSSYKSKGASTGLYIELKNPAYHNTLGFPLSMEDHLISELKSFGYPIKGADVPQNTSNVLPVIIQCFDENSLQYLNSITDIPLVQLMDNTHYAYLNTSVIDKISTYANGIGPDKNYFEFLDYNSSMNIINEAHNLNMVVHPWTFRADSGIWPVFNGSFESELTYFYCCLRVDGLFIEFPDRYTFFVCFLLLLFFKSRIFIFM